MSKTFNIHKVRNHNKIILNHLEIFYLRLHIHNLNTVEISNFLEIDSKQINKIRSSLYAKFNTKNWTKIISIAFKNRYLIKKDFIEDNIKYIALEQTQLISDKYLKKDASEYNIKDLRQDLFEYYYKLEIQLNDSYDNREKNKKLTATESDIIKLKYADCNNTQLMSQLNISEDKLNRYFKNIFEKLEVNNWFNTFKKSVAYNILDINSDKLLIMEEEIKKSATDIYRLKSLKRLKPSEKKLSVYTFLIEMYSNIEFSKLLIYPD